MRDIPDLISPAQKFCWNLYIELPVRKAVELVDHKLNRSDDHLNRTYRRNDAKRKNNNQNNQIFHKVCDIDGIDRALFQPDKGHTDNLVRIVLVQWTVHRIVGLASDLDMIRVIILSLVHYLLIDFRQCFCPDHAVSLLID